MHKFNHENPAVDDNLKIISFCIRMRRNFNTGRCVINTFWLLMSGQRTQNGSESYSWRAGASSVLSAGSEWFAFSIWCRSTSLVPVHLQKKSRESISLRRFSQPVRCPEEESNVTLRRTKWHWRTDTWRLLKEQDYHSEFKEPWDLSESEERRLTPCFLSPTLKWNTVQMKLDETWQFRWLSQHNM